MKNSGFDLLKLRASWGKLGNNSIGNYEYQSTYKAHNYSFNNLLVNGLAVSVHVNLLLGPVEISPTSWEDLDADCYVHIDNKRILIINHDPYYSVTGKTHEYKVLVLHYDSKEQLKKDFQKFIEIAGLDGSGKLSLNASGEFIQSGQENKKAIIENISVDFHEDWSGREYYFIVFDAITSEGNKESHFIMIPAEFV